MPTPAPLHLKVFIGSPGDVNDERQLAMKLLNQLPYDPFLKGRVTFEAMAWDHPQAGALMLAGIPAQDSVTLSLGKPADCDIVVICLWSRLGSPIAQPDYEKPEGGYYTGTEWEYHNAVQSFIASGNQRPIVLLYHRIDEPVTKVSPREKQAYLDRVAHMEQVEAFLQACRSHDGSIPNHYEGVNGFVETLEQHLKAIARQRLEALAASPVQTDSVSKTESVSSLPAFWTGSPFPGLRAFTDKDAAIFFGRGKETDELLARLRDPAQRFIAVVGASGSGKSSLVWAGLLPRLMGGAMEGSAGWVWVRFTPGQLGDNPFVALANGWKNSFETSGQTLLEFAETLQHSPDNLAGLLRLALANRPEPAELLLFIDQFEELFTVVKNPETRSAFVRFLQAASTSNRLRVVVSVRADFYAQCVECGLAELLRKNGSFALDKPGTGALYQMVTKPAGLGGLAFEDGLVDAILHDTGGQPGALPLLAFALERLYQAKTKEGLLSIQAYEGFGKVQGAIGLQADAAFAKLPEAVQAKFTEVFRELVEVDERGVPTRRREKLSEVSHSVQSQQLIDAMIKARLLVADGDGEEATLEVAHEALFKSWKQLADWVTQTADDHRLRRQITQLADYWDKHGRKDEHRWPDQRVKEVALMLEHLGMTLEDFEPDREQPFLGPIDPVAMLKEIEQPATTHGRRAMIGVRLDLLGDTRKGVGLREDGLPDIDWVTIDGGEVTIAIREDARNPDSEIINTLTRQVAAFSLARYPVTVAQFQAFLDECHDGHSWHLPSGAPFDLPDSYAPSKARARHGNHPMDMVCWYDAVIFCHWLSVRLGYQVRLPTEFEWQCAAIGGKSPSPFGRGVGVRAELPEEQRSHTQNYPWGEDWNPAEEPWRANTYESDLGRSTAVGLYPEGASESGILDLSGTVWEWCQNAYDNPDDVTASTAGAARVLRGGSWLLSARGCRSAFRGNDQPDYQDYSIGFRCARVQS